MRLLVKMPARIFQTMLNAEISTKSRIDILVGNIKKSWRAVINGSQDSAVWSLSVSWNLQSKNFVAPLMQKFPWTMFHRNIHLLKIGIFSYFFFFVDLKYNYCTNHCKNFMWKICIHYSRMDRRSDFGVYLWSS